MIAVADLERQLADIDVPQAIGALVTDGLATQLCELVGASRAAVRTDQLLI